MSKESANRDNSDLAADHLTNLHLPSKSELIRYAFAELEIVGAAMSSDEIESIKRFLELVTDDGYPTSQIGPSSCDRVAIRWLVNEDYLEAIFLDDTGDFLILHYQGDDMIYNKEIKHNEVIASNEVINYLRKTLKVMSSGITKRLPIL